MEKKPRKKGSGGSRPGAGAKKNPQTVPSKTTSYRIELSTLNALKKLGVGKLTLKINDFFKELVINEKINRIVITPEKINDLTDLINVCCGITVDGGILGNHMEESLYDRISDFMNYKSTKGPEDEERLKQLYMDAIMAFSQFLDSNEGAPRQLFSDLHSEHYEKLNELIKEI